MNRFKKLLTYFRYFYLLFDLNKLKKDTPSSTECVVLGNGPSLKESFEQDMDFIKGKDIFCVNNFAQTQQYSELKPKYYVITDSLYYDDTVLLDFQLENKSNLNEDQINYLKKLKLNISSTYEKIFQKTDWKMILFLPIQSKGSRYLKGIDYKNQYVTVIYYSTIPMNFKLDRLRNLLYRLNLGMPSPQTVIIAAIFLALKTNYKKVILYGADHSWHEDLYLRNDNILCFKDKHFYFEENQNTIRPIITDIKTGKTSKMHEQFFALYKVFYSHELLLNFSTNINSVIINFSKYSWIDAYQKKNFKDNNIIVN